MRTRLVVLAGAVLLAACGEDPQSVADLNPDFVVREEATDRGIVLVVETVSEGFSRSMDVTKLGLDMRRIARFIATHPDKHPDVAGVRLEVTTPTVDVYGHDGMTRSLDLVMDRTTMERINYDAIMTAAHFLNLTTPTVKHPVGRQLIAGYCEDETAQEYARDFCRVARR
ncbi:hypothetical protein [Roseospira goensis]|uniref:Lipoprotein n=1 Tax=Roseospira goensis TaxID=391922 RepID=A0A7W6S2F6_9PROT|nr:hypothetical protein [Roseospira goensis]MBB4287648.1 hypothetical protein [Roseospira goensis]